LDGDVSYDLRILSRKRLELARVDARLREAGATGEGDDLVLERGAVVPSVLSEEIGIGVTVVSEGDAREDFAAVLDLVLDLADELGARVYDPQVGREVTRADREEVLAVFG
jgi:hypothetical protein